MAQVNITRLEDYSMGLKAQAENMPLYGKNKPPAMKCTPNVRHKNLIFGGAFFMKKYSVGIKLEIVQYYLTGKLTFMDTAKNTRQHITIKNKIIYFESPHYFL